MVGVKHASVSSTSLEVGDQGITLSQASDSSGLHSNVTKLIKTPDYSHVDKSRTNVIYSETSAEAAAAIKHLFTPLLTSESKTSVSKKQNSNSILNISGDDILDTSITNSMLSANVCPISLSLISPSLPCLPFALHTTDTTGRLSPCEGSNPSLQPQSSIKSPLFHKTAMVNARTSATDLSSNNSAILFKNDGDLLKSKSPHQDDDNNCSSGKIYTKVNNFSSVNSSPKKKEKFLSSMSNTQCNIPPTSIVLFSTDSSVLISPTKESTTKVSNSKFLHEENVSNLSLVCSNNIITSPENSIYCSTDFPCSSRANSVSKIHDFDNEAIRSYQSEIKSLNKSPSTIISEQQKQHILSAIFSQRLPKSRTKINLTSKLQNAQESSSDIKICVDESPLSNTKSLGGIAELVSVACPIRNNFSIISSDHIPVNDTSENVSKTHENLISNATDSPSMTFSFCSMGNTVVTQLASMPQACSPHNVLSSGNVQTYKSTFISAELEKSVVKENFPEERYVTPQNTDGCVVAAICVPLKSPRRSTSCNTTNIHNIIATPVTCQPSTESISSNIDIIVDMPVKEKSPRDLLVAPLSMPSSDDPHDKKKYDLGNSNINNCVSASPQEMISNASDHESVLNLSNICSNSQPISSSNCTIQTQNDKQSPHSPLSTVSVDSISQQGNTNVFSPGRFQHKYSSNSSEQVSAKQTNCNMQLYSCDQLISEVVSPIHYSFLPDYLQDNDHCSLAHLTSNSVKSVSELQYFQAPITLHSTEMNAIKTSSNSQFENLTSENSTSKEQSTSLHVSKKSEEYSCQSKDILDFDSQRSWSPTTSIDVCTSEIVFPSHANQTSKANDWTTNDSGMKTENSDGKNNKSSDEDEASSDASLLGHNISWNTATELFNSNINGNVDTDINESVSISELNKGKYGELRSFEEDVNSEKNSVEKSRSDNIFFSALSSQYSSADHCSNNQDKEFFGLNLCKHDHNNKQKLKHDAGENVRENQISNTFSDDSTDPTVKICNKTLVSPSDLKPNPKKRLLGEKNSKKKTNDSIINIKRVTRSASKKMKQDYSRTISPISPSQILKVNSVNSITEIDTNNESKINTSATEIVSLRSEIPLPFAIEHNSFTLTSESAIQNFPKNNSDPIVKALTENTGKYITAPNNQLAVDVFLESHCTNEETKPANKALERSDDSNCYHVPNNGITRKVIECDNDKSFSNLSRGFSDSKNSIIATENILRVEPNSLNDPDDACLTIKGPTSIPQTNVSAKLSTVTKDIAKNTNFKLSNTNPKCKIQFDNCHKTDISVNSNVLVENNEGQTCVGKQSQNHNLLHSEQYSGYYNQENNSSKRNSLYNSVSDYSSQEYSIPNHLEPSVNKTAFLQNRVNDNGSLDACNVGYNETYKSHGTPSNQGQVNPEHLTNHGATRMSSHRNQGYSHSNHKSKSFQHHSFNDHHVVEAHNNNVTSTNILDNTNVLNYANSYTQTQRSSDNTSGVVYNNSQVQTSLGFTRPRSQTTNSTNERVNRSSQTLIPSNQASFHSVFTHNDVNCTLNSINISKQSNQYVATTNVTDHHKLRNQLNGEHLVGNSHFQNSIPIASKMQHNEGNKMHENKLPNFALSDHHSTLKGTSPDMKSISHFQQHTQDPYGASQIHPYPLRDGNQINGNVSAIFNRCATDNLSHRQNRASEDKVIKSKSYAEPINSQRKSLSGSVNIHSSSGNYTINHTQPQNTESQSKTSVKNQLHCHDGMHSTMPDMYQNYIKTSSQNINMTKQQVHHQSVNTQQLYTANHVSGLHSRNQGNALHENSFVNPSSCSYPNPHNLLQCTPHHNLPCHQDHSISPNYANNLHANSHTRNIHNVDPRNYINSYASGHSNVNGHFHQPGQILPNNHGHSQMAHQQNYLVQMHANNYNIIQNTSRVAASRGEHGIISCDSNNIQCNVNNQVLSHCDNSIVPVPQVCHAPPLHNNGSSSNIVTESHHNVVNYSSNPSNHMNTNIQEHRSSVHVLNRNCNAASQRQTIAKTNQPAIYPQDSTVQHNTGIIQPPHVNPHYNDPSSSMHNNNNRLHQAESNLHTNAQTNGAHASQMHAHLDYSSGIQHGQTGASLPQMNCHGHATHAPLPSHNMVYQENSSLNSNHVANQQVTYNSNSVLPYGTLNYSDVQCMQNGMIQPSYGDYQRPKHHTQTPTHVGYIPQACDIHGNQIGYGDMTSSSYTSNVMPLQSSNDKMATFPSESNFSTTKREQLRSDGTVMLPPAHSSQYSDVYQSSSTTSKLVQEAQSTVNQVNHSTQNWDKTKNSNGSSNGTHDKSSCPPSIPSDILSVPKQVYPSVNNSSLSSVKESPIHSNIYSPMTNPSVESIDNMQSSRYFSCQNSKTNADSYRNKVTNSTDIATDNFQSTSNTNCNFPPLNIELPNELSENTSKYNPQISQNSASLFNVSETDVISKSKVNFDHQNQSIINSSQYQAFDLAAKNSKSREKSLEKEHATSSNGLSSVAEEKINTQRETLITFETNLDDSTHKFSLNEESNHSTEDATEPLQVISNIPEKDTNVSIPLSTPEASLISNNNVPASNISSYKASGDIDIDIEECECSDNHFPNISSASSNVQSDKPKVANSSSNCSSIEEKFVDTSKQLPEDDLETVIGTIDELASVAESIKEVGHESDTSTHNSVAASPAFYENPNNSIPPSPQLSRSFSRASSPEILRNVQEATEYHKPTLLMRNFKTKKHAKLQICRQCDQVFSTRQCLVRHIERRHRATPDQHNCNSCHKKFSSERALARHMQQHRTYPCKLCGEEFLQRVRLKEHMQEHTQDSLSCNYCQKECTSVQALISHVNSHKRTKHKHECAICSKIFANKRNLDVHSLIHTGDKPHSCSNCSKTFSVRSNMLAHKELCMNKCKFNCNQCSRSFPIESLYKRHIAEHEGNYLHKCTHCDKGFSKKSGLKAHSAVHEHIRKKVNCLVCKTVLSSESKLRVHMKTHETTTSVTCPICKKHLARANQLADHMARHNNKRNHKCPQCDRVFFYKCNIVPHLRVAHLGEKTHVCPTCLKSFGTKHTLNVHITIHSGEKKHQCGNCGKSFATKSNYKRHLKCHLTVQSG